jgi:hypothetical protein
LYGLYELAFGEELRRDYGTGSTMTLAGRTFRLPIRL